MSPTQKSLLESFRVENLPFLTSIVRIELIYYAIHSHITILIVTVTANGTCLYVSLNASNISSGIFEHKPPTSYPLYE